MTADDQVNFRHGLGHTHVVAVNESAVAPFFQTAVAEADNHIHLFRRAENLHHLPGGIDWVGERSRSATGVKKRLFAKQSKDAKANATALDYEIAADHSILG